MNPNIIMSPITNSHLTNNWLLASEIVFSLVCLIFSLVIWLAIFNLNNIKLALLQLEIKTADLQKTIHDLEHKLEMQKMKPEEILLSPSTLIKLAELVLLFQSKKLTKLLFLKTIFK